MSLPYLSGKEILDAIAAKELEITPFDPEQVAQGSVDLHLGPNLYVAESTCEPLDIRKPDEVFRPLTMDSKGFLLKPYMFALGCTIERVRSTHDLKVFGKSSPARKSINVEAAGRVESGFHGPITLELFSILPIWIYPGVPICQIEVCRLQGTRQESYAVRGHYTDANASADPWPQLSRAHLQKMRHYKDPSSCG